MKIFSKCKDGGPESPVDAYFLVEIKCLFSIALLKFNEGSRENYHSHAFNAFTWFLCGELEEIKKKIPVRYQYTGSLIPKYTPRDNCHRVVAYRDSWCFTIRGPWSKYWTEWNERTDTTIKFTHGRKVIHE